MQINPPATVSRCGVCGSTNYSRVVARDESGAMRYTEILQCTRCSREFANLDLWRQDGASTASPAVA